MSEEELKLESADVAGDFLAQNAEFFAQAFAVLKPVFDSSGLMRVVSEESEMTMVVGVKEPDSEDEMDVDCVLLDPDQESLRDCLDALFYEE